MFWMLIGVVMAQNPIEWVVVNDTVMGGRSSSSVQSYEDVVSFQGVVSLKNNGGFASLRSTGSLDVSSYSGVEVSISGSDVPIQFIVWMQGANLYYAHEVKVGSEPQIVDFEDFIPKSYGRLVRAPNLLQQPRSQVAVGVLVGGGFEGEFDLNIEDIEFIESVDQEQKGTGTEQSTETMTEQMELVLLRAIQRGVPIYNSGKPDECAAIYQTVLEDILLLAPNGLTSTQQQQITRVLQQSSSMTGTDRAWAFRGIIDQLLQS